VNRDPSPSPEPAPGAETGSRAPWRRSVWRWIHLVLAVPIVGYIYSPFDRLPDYAPATRLVFLPAMALAGLWMWKGPAVRRFLSKLSMPRGAAENP